jgi:hypothetical protein
VGNSDDGRSKIRILRWLGIAIFALSGIPIAATAVVTVLGVTFSLEAFRADIEAAATGMFYARTESGPGHALVIALPFPPDDPIYGARPPQDTDTVFLGNMAIQGERGLLQFSSDWLLRLRYDPFYGFLEARSLERMAGANGGGQGACRVQNGALPPGHRTALVGAI